MTDEFRRGYLAGLTAARQALTHELRRKAGAGDCYSPEEHALIRLVLARGRNAVGLMLETIEHAREAVEMAGVTPRKPDLRTWREMKRGA